jgi:t-SNARE complex subunit (syntaxin)
MTERGAAKLARKARIEKAIDWIMAIIAGVTVVVGLGAGVWFLLQKGSG